MLLLEVVELHYVGVQCDEFPLTVFDRYFLETVVLALLKLPVKPDKCLNVYVWNICLEYL